MSEHILKTIADIEARIDARIKETERAIIKDRATINDLCAIAGIDLKYKIDEEATAIGVNGTTALATIKPDEFFGKPQATCVRQALNMLRAVGRAPSTVEAIYDVLIAGGFDFPTKAREAAIQGLAISIGKNSNLFVKLPNGLIGVKDWYGQTPRARNRSSKSDDNGGGSQTEDQVDTDVPSQDNDNGSQTNEGDTP